MKIMLDTNVLFSALLFPDSKPGKVLGLVAEKYNLILCDHIKSELCDVSARKSPILLDALDALPDPKDQPILNAAIFNDVDIIITGDKHFLKLNIERPEILTPSDFLTGITN